MAQLSMCRHVLSFRNTVLVLTSYALLQGKRLLRLINFAPDFTSQAYTAIFLVA